MFYYLFYFEKCIQSQEILRMVNLTQIDYSSFLKICPIMLYNLEIGLCKFDDGEKNLNKSES